MIHSTPVRTVLWLGGVESYPATLGMIYPAFVRQYSKWTVGPAEVCGLLSSLLVITVTHRKPDTPTLQKKAKFTILH